MNTERFTKVYDQLIGLGLPPRLVLLYGKLCYHAGRNGRCFPTWETLAKEIGVKSPVTVYRLLLQSKALRLVTWKRRGHWSSNEYQVLTPDIAFLQRQGFGFRRCRDATYIDYENATSETLQERNPEKKAGEKTDKASQPASCSTVTCGLAGLLTEVWAHLGGTPGPKLLARIAATLGNIPLEQFRAFLISRRRKAQGFGLALELARELSQRWNADAAARQQAVEAAEADRAALNERARQAAIATLADPKASDRDRELAREILGQSA